MITIALTVFLPDEIKSILPLNLITINLITHLIYTAIRAYVRSNNSNNERC
ncbi:MAG: DUF6040 family protein [Acetatifactor sp.]|nr:DUF6040 family protein [Acetatifactor sp.]